VFLDATYCKARVGGRVVSRAVVIATGVTADGHREVLGVDLTRANVDGSGFPTRSARLVLLTRDQHDSTQDQGASCSVAIGTASS
jgi:hypothetical protein